MELWKTRLELIVFIETYQDHILHVRHTIKGQFHILK
jgi:hypothetical protein